MERASTGTRSVRACTEPSAEGRLLGARPRGSLAEVEGEAQDPAICVPGAGGLAGGQTWHGDSPVCLSGG